MSLSRQSLALVLTTQNKQEEIHQKHTQKHTENPKLNLNHKQSLVASTPVRTAHMSLHSHVTDKQTIMKTRCHAIAKMTAWCAQYMSALKIVCKHKSSRRLRKNLHITSLSLFGGEIIFEVFQQMWSRYLNVTDGQTEGQYCGITAG